MADQNAVDLLTRTRFYHVFGNVASEVYSIDAAGADIGEFVRFGRIDANVQLLDSIVFIAGGGTALSTIEIGVKDVAATSQDDPDYFLAATLLSAASINRRANVAPPITTDAVKELRGVIAAANSAATVLVTVVLFYKTVGNL